MVTVEASERNWKRLNRHKEPGESLDDVIGEALDALEEQQQAHEA